MARVAGGKPFPFPNPLQAQAGQGRPAAASSGRSNEPFGAPGSPRCSCVSSPNSAQAKVPVTLKEYLVLMEALDKDVIDRSVEDFYYPVAHGPGEGRAQPRPLRPGVRPRLQGPGADGRRRHRRHPGRVAAKISEKFLTDEEKAQIEALGGWDKLMETLEERLEEQKKRHEGGNKMIGTGGTSPVRRQRLQSRRRPHRPGQGPARQGGQGLGQARIQEPRRQRRTRHPQHQGRAAPPAQMGPRGAPGRTRSRRHDQGHRREGLSRHRHAPRAAQHRSAC